MVVVEITHKYTQIELGTKHNPHLVEIYPSLYTNGTPIYINQFWALDAPNAQSKQSTSSGGELKTYKYVTPYLFTSLRWLLATIFSP